MYNDYYNSSAMSGFMTAYGIFAIALLIVMIVAMWRIFTKAGEAGWKCLIPIYSSYKLYDIGWEGSYFWAPLVVSFIGGIVATLLMRMGQAGAVIGGLISLGCGIFALVISCKMAIRLAHRFGKKHGLRRDRPVAVLPHRLPDHRPGQRRLPPRARLWRRHPALRLRDREGRRRQAALPLIDRIPLRPAPFPAGRIFTPRARPSTPQRAGRRRRPADASHSARTRTGRCRGRAA